MFKLVTTELGENLVLVHFRPTSFSFSPLHLCTFSGRLFGAPKLEVTICILKLIDDRYLNIFSAIESA